jgi:DNA helicase HerA-like ATPase
MSQRQITQPSIAAIRDALLRALSILRAEGDRKWPEIGDLLPLGELEGFDSWAAEEAIVILASELGEDFSPKFQPFFDRDGELRKFADVVEAVGRELEKRGAK